MREWRGRRTGSAQIRELSWKKERGGRDERSGRGRQCRWSCCFLPKKKRKAKENEQVHPLNMALAHTTNKHKACVAQPTKKVFLCGIFFKAIVHLCACMFRRKGTLARTNQCLGFLSPHLSVKVPIMQTSASLLSFAKEPFLLESEVLSF